MSALLWVGNTHLYSGYLHWYVSLWSTSRDTGSPTWPSLKGWRTFFYEIEERRMSSMENKNLIIPQSSQFYINVLALLTFVFTKDSELTESFVCICELLLLYFPALENFKSYQWVFCKMFLEAAVRNSAKYLATGDSRNNICQKKLRKKRLRLSQKRLRNHSLAVKWGLNLQLTFTIRCHDYLYSPINTFKKGLNLTFPKWFCYYSVFYLHTRFLAVLLNSKKFFIILTNTIEFINNLFIVSKWYPVLWGKKLIYLTP